MTQRNSQVPYPSIQIQGALVVRKEGRKESERGRGRENERRGGQEREREKKKRWSELFQHWAASLRGESMLVVAPPSLLSSLPGPQYLRAPRIQERGHVRIGRQGRSFRDEQWS